MRAPKGAAVHRIVYGPFVRRQNLEGGKAELLARRRRLIFMESQEPFAIASFRSRQAVFRLEALLRQKGVESRVISTPRAVSLGCGLSLRFDLSRFPAVLSVYRAGNVPNLIGFYRVEPGQAGLRVSPLETGL